MYIKVNNGIIEKYPYSIGELRKDNPQTSFPKNPTLTLLEEWGVFPVQPVNSPSVDYTKNVRESTPVYNNGWTQVWEIIDATADEIAERVSGKSIEVRYERDRLLAETDWVVVKSLESGFQIPTEWQTYRQGLRDIPEQNGFPFSVMFPTKPY